MTPRAAVINIMASLPDSPQPKQAKTIAEIAKAANQAPEPNPNKKKPSLGGWLNSQMEAEQKKFVGCQVTVKTNEERITGVCIAFSPSMNLVIRTDTEKIFIRHWQYIRRERNTGQ